MSATGAASAAITRSWRVASGDAADRVRSRRPPSFPDPVSQAATANQIEHERFVHWAGVLNHRVFFHRKLWEWCYILEAFDRAGMMEPGGRVLGFGVGTEALPAVMASRGVQVVATNQAAAEAGIWATSHQHAASLEALVREDICPRVIFDELVTFRPVDMRAIPSDLRGFDAVWSSCCFEHLGSPEAGLEFVLAAMDCLRPGGLDVHTTEFDVHDSSQIVDLGNVVLYRRRELAWLARQLRLRGHDIRLNYCLPNEHPNDRHEDVAPHTEVHVRVVIGPTAATSFGLIIRKSA